MTKLCRACGGPVCPNCGGCIQEGECGCNEAEVERLRANEAAIKALAHANKAITNTLMTAITWVLLDGADSDKLPEGIDLCTRLLADARAALK